MSQLININGTNYDITTGQNNISGTNYIITTGKTKVNGTLYDIQLAPHTFTNSGSWYALPTRNINQTTDYSQASALLSASMFIENPPDLILGLVGRTSSNNPTVVWPVATFLLKLARQNPSKTMLIWSTLYYGTRGLSTMYPIVSNIENLGTTSIGSSIIGPIKITKGASLPGTMLNLYMFAYGNQPSYETPATDTTQYDNKSLAYEDNGNLAVFGGSFSTTPSCVISNPTTANSIVWNSGTFLRLDMETLASLNAYQPGTTNSAHFQLTGSTGYGSNYNATFANLSGGESNGSGSYTWFEYK